MWKEYTNFEQQQNIFSTSKIDHKCKNDWVMETKIQGYIFTEKNDWMRQKPKFYYLAALAELQRSLECRYFIYSYFILFYFIF